MSSDREEQGWLTGKLLLASIQLSDSFFGRTVIGIIEHTDDGTVGFILNRPSDILVGDVLEPIPPQFSEKSHVFLGGPVQIENAIGLSDGESTTPALIDIREMHVADDHRIRIFAGYSGWDAGQVEWEIGMESWLVVDATDDDFFTEQPMTLYERVADRCGYDPSPGPNPLLN
jgi:putative transcriptional regulator